MLSTRIIPYSKQLSAYLLGWGRGWGESELKEDIGQSLLHVTVQHHVVWLQLIEGKEQRSTNYAPETNHIQ